MAAIRTFAPQYLYRYRSLRQEIAARELSTIDENYIWCSDFKELNDPMEGIYDADPNVPDQIKDQLFRRKLAFGICSFSEINNHELMWAHYADQFRGICIEYCFAELRNFLPQYVEFVRLSYNEDAYRVDREHSLDHDLPKKILCNKNHRWLYEREWRLLNQDLGRLDISAHCISAVFVGNRIEDRDRLVALLNKRNIPLYDMQIDRYSIKFPKHENRRLGSRYLFHECVTHIEIGTLGALFP